MVRTNVPSSQQHPTSNGSKVNLPFNGKRHSRQSQLVPWFCRKSPSVRDFPDMFDLPLGTELKIMAKSGKNKTFRIKKLIFHVSGPCFFPFQSRPKFTRLKCFSGQEWKSWYPITKTGGIYACSSFPWPRNTLISVGFHSFPNMKWGDSNRNKSSLELAEPLGLWCCKVCGCKVCEFCNSQLKTIGYHEVPSKNQCRAHGFPSTLWLFNIAMENGPFIDGLPINSMVIFHGYVK